MSLLIENARVVGPSGVQPGNILVEDGKIAAVGPDIRAGGEVIDARGQYVLPGGVDAHTHFDLDLGAFRATDDFYTGSVAAACGGTTTIVDHMAFGPKGCRLVHQVDVYHELARDAVIDYSFHGVVQHVDDQVLADMATLVERGITSYKVYLTYGGKLDDADVLRVFARAAELGLIVCVHCENDAMIGYLTRKLLAEGHGGPDGHPRSRPEACEAEAVYRMIALAGAAGEAPLYVVHLSTGQGLNAIREARARGQRHIFAETCPQYLLLNEDRYADPVEGLKYIMAPPLRPGQNCDALWSALGGGDIDVVATDHCPFNFHKEKQAGVGDFSKCPGGAPGVETRMMLMFSEGFMRGRLSLPEVVRLCCERPARIFGLYPAKGALLPGSDADMVFFDPDVEWVLTHPRLHERVDYTPYEGFVLKGAPTMTLSRGEVVAKNGVPCAARGRGRFIVRSRSDLDGL